MRISNIEWLKKRLGFIRKLGEQTARQRQIIDLLDNEAGLTEQERKLLHVLATAEKNDLQAQENERKQTIQKRIEGKKQRRERNHRLFLAAGLLIEAGLVTQKQASYAIKKTGYYRHLRKLSTIWRHPQTQTRKCLHPCSGSLVLPRSFARYARS
ncbi:hypothetical protein ACEXJW_003722 [Shigella flexneri]